MQQIVLNLPPKIAVRRSTRKLGLTKAKPKEFDLTYLDEWLETKNQVQEMAFACGRTKANSDQKKTKSNSNKSERLKETNKQKKKDASNETHANSAAKVDCFVCKEIK